MRTTIGASLAALLLLFAPASAGGGKAEDVAVIAGTVFREPGFALPRAEVTLIVKTPPAGGKVPKPQKTVSDGRGEFSFRVPAARADYLVAVKAAGFTSEEKVAALSGAPERVDVYFNLKSVQNGKE